ncbi:DUF4270 domain-containing protein [Flavobacterium columnare NBRC 100251 = ATCC 23463]|uniref:DUF4270 domain-containing protein n=1 Tax=Flavobacterium columnare (strain ATCC 49512 / CIP 103533 / TG 44/87) TaxID=1041826 RepID=G8XBR4_FLACA|nr:DUF4270 domain-containing protein [Flavobacterium columnare]AEW87479.1 hypothetical protein FCOL_13420 [Flavobacterium columnare ATCC 49512]MBF6651907.1 DUF4270 domain-containing protein [Flavobacterium columnare]MBF6655436.1 DUF4270 domain-containing protein [Flavobacterium columnare]MBF6658289.1 DUF4270 domain-containing protein [Flavobacterium columnare]OOB83210.1 hypothetical protein BZL53_05565 [Flavobacterium columnare]
MRFKTFEKLSIFLFSVFFLSCDQDYNTLGADLVGDETFAFLGGEDKSSSVTINDLDLGPVQSNNLPINHLGLLKSDYFGETTASFVTQLQLETAEPVFGTGIEVDSVVLSVPYFSTKLSTNTNGRGIYRLDSIYTNTKDYYTDFKSDKLPTFNLEVFRNNFALNSYDVNDITKNAKYYSDQESILNVVVGEKLNNAVNSNENTNFKPNQAEFEKPKVDELTQKLLPIKYNPENIAERLSPRMRLHLDKSHFENSIIKADSRHLISNSAFVDYYRGLTFRASGNGEVMMGLDFKKGDVTIHYKQDKADNKGKEMKTLVLKMTGNTLNVLKHSKSAAYSSALSSDVPTDNLFLKGGQGSIAEIKIDQALIDDLKNKGALVNDASLYFTVDPNFVNSLSSSNKSFYYLNPMRLYLFNAEKTRSLLDYTNDITKLTNFPKKDKYVHGGILQKVNGKYMYRIRLTDHINQIINDKTGTYTNVRLGLAVAESIYITPEAQGLSAISALKNTTNILKSIPSTTVISPLGVVLGGMQGENRVQFKISYTKRN